MPTSPMPTQRQRGDRDIIDAGHQLCAKELRYLRTVRVTAAVYWDLKVKAWTFCFLCTSTGQMSGPIRQLSFLLSPVFLVNSRRLRFSDTFFVLLEQKKPCFLRSHTWILPSSFVWGLFKPLQNLQTNLCWIKYGTILKTVRKTLFFGNFPTL